MTAKLTSTFGWLDLVHAPVFVVDMTTGQILGTNEALRRIMPAALPPAPMALRRLLGDTAAQALADFIRAMPADGSRNRLSLICPTRNGPTTLILHLAAAAEQPATWVVTLDARGLLFDDTASDGATETFRSIIRDLPIGIDIFDSSLRGVFCSRYSDNLYLYDPFYDQEMNEWFDRAFPAQADRQHAKAEWAAALAALARDPDQPQAMEWRVMCRDGKYRVLANRISKAGNHYSFVYWDITEQRRLEDQLRKLASTDMLTGLYNRRHFVAKSAQILAESQVTGFPLCMLILDVDHFKFINDTRGHAAGDAALVMVAHRCRAALRPGDLLARFGGEEFVMLLADTSSAEALALAERLRSLIADQPLRWGDDEFFVTASIGVATADAGTAPLDQLLENADRALYAAKNGGRNRVMVFATAA